MNVTVINGSPKGKNSTTIQSVLYLEKHFPDDKFEIIHAGQKIKSLEKGRRLDTIMDTLVESDLILFAYPVYTFLVPFQLHRFIELVKEHSRAVRLAGKKMTQITTSMHFYDMTAHCFVEENSADLNMDKIKGFSASMDDLLTEKGRDELSGFWKLIRFAMKNDGFESLICDSLPNGFIYEKSLNRTEKKEYGDTVIVTSCTPSDLSLENMISDFRAVYPGVSRVINLNDFTFAGGCLGCFNCASDGVCVYRDRFDDFLREKIQKADAIVYAASISNHSLGSLFKLYDDRQFCNGHRMVTRGMPVGYILSGNFSKEINLSRIIEARSEVGHFFPAGIVCDESGDREKIQREMKRMSGRLVYALENKVVYPRNFWGIGGMKIFRDLIYVMQGLMKEDHRFYKKHGIYDFPYKQVKTRLLMKMAGMLMGFPSIRKKMRGDMNQIILKPYKRVLEKY